MRCIYCLVMDRDSIGKKISDISVKKLKKKYPFIIYGEYRGSFVLSRTYHNNLGLEPEIGYRTLISIDAEMFFSLFSHENAPQYKYIMEGKYSTTRYLSSLFNDKEIEDLLIDIEGDILKTFYSIGKFVDPKNKLGYKDFFVRYKFDNSSPDSDGFTDADVSYFKH